MDKINFYDLLNKNKLITPIWKYILDIIDNEIKDIDNKNDYIDIFACYFSLIDNGNTCISLDSNVLKTKWFQRIDSKIKELEEKEDFSQDEFDSIKNRSNEIINSKILDSIKDLSVVDDKKIFKVDEDNYLYLRKYYSAKIGIEKSIERLFKKEFNNSPYEISFKSGYALTDGQKEIVNKGSNKNLIVTGGPGTGKTTSILSLLIVLLKNDKNYNIRLCAMSGKAASRMKESLTKGFNDLDQSFKDNNKEIMDIIAGTLKVNDETTEEFTIHRLLSIDFRTNKFKYNEENQFNENSIFVIDEASMIDVNLFNSLLKAIPTGARVFILGDKDQLPSVEPGSVFADLTNTPSLNDYKVMLTESNRFSSDSDIYELADIINNNKEFDNNKMNYNKCESFEFMPLPIKTLRRKGKKEERTANLKDWNYPIAYYENDGTNNEQEKNIKYIINKWAIEFYINENLNVVKSSFNIAENIDKDSLDEIDAFTTYSKVLCAENDGIRGTNTLNRLIKKKIYDSIYKNNNELYKNIEKVSLNGNYPGQVMMITKNNKLLKLYNGDTGILVTFENDNTLYFMIKKTSSIVSRDGKKTDEIFKLGSYLFYPFRLIATDEISLAYTITIHKSQGSDYDNILVMLPTKEGHPLLNRQIVYTAITRTCGNTYILSTKDRMEEAKETKLERDTNIKIRI